MSNTSTIVVPKGGAVVAKTVIDAAQVKAGVELVKHENAYNRSLKTFQAQVVAFFESFGIATEADLKNVKSVAYQSLRAAYVNALFGSAELRETMTNEAANKRFSRLKQVFATGGTQSEADINAKNAAKQRQNEAKSELATKLTDLEVAKNRIADLKAENRALQTPELAKAATVVEMLTDESGKMPTKPQLQKMVQASELQPALFDACTEISKSAKNLLQRKVAIEPNDNELLRLAAFTVFATDLSSCKVEKISVHGPIAEKLETLHNMFRVK
jgi:hypothetical protein